MKNFNEYVTTPLKVLLNNYDSYDELVTEYDDRYEFILLDKEYVVSKDDIEGLLAIIAKYYNYFKYNGVDE